jgi:hypothetical protein
VRLSRSLRVDVRIPLNPVVAFLMVMGVKWTNPVEQVKNLIPRNQSQLEKEAKGVLKLVFWAALLAPVIIVPAYYLLVSFGLLPPIHLPG